MSLGIIEELEFDCLPRPGEFVVCHVNYATRFLSASEKLGRVESVRGPWSAFRHRHPRAGDSTFYVGDIVSLVSVPSEPGAASLVKDE